MGVLRGVLGCVGGHSQLASPGKEVVSIPLRDVRAVRRTELCVLRLGGWKYTAGGRWIRWIRWTNVSGDVGIQFDVFAAQQPNSSLATWTVWAGPSVDQPTWAIHASPYALAPMIADLCEELAHGTGTRLFSPSAQRQAPCVTTTAPAIATPQARRSR
jgi:hypothetical protein